MYSSNIVSLIRSLSDGFQIASHSHSESETQDNCSHDAHCHSEHCPLPPLPSSGNAPESSVPHHQHDEGSNAFYHPSFDQSLSEFSSENEFPISLETSQDYSEYDVESTSSSKEKVSQSVADAQTNLRKQIIQIQTDPKIPASEKSKKIQDLMTNKWNSNQMNASANDERIINKIANKRADFSLVLESDKGKTMHASGNMGCKHYQRGCKLQAHCCGNWYTCRFCHDEISDHTITRNLIDTMMCMNCSQVQPAGQECSHCANKVSKYYCKECKLWDDDPKKNIYHCHDCGICRIGKGLGIDYFHCPTCNVCMAIGLKGKHKCIERNLESDCPICGEYMFTSTSTVIFMPCGHCMHHRCHQKHIQTSYQCPTCLKSLADVSEYFRRIDEALKENKMPPEYENIYSHIYCNDCEKKCHASYHFMYHKCAYCKGYNTKLLSTMEGLPKDAIIAEPSVKSASNESTLEGGASSTNLIQSSQGSFTSMISSGVWCHSCQGPTELAEDACVNCGSDFVEEL